MADLAPSSVSSATGGSIAGTHAERTPLRVLAGAATGKEFNTIQSAIFPIACWRAHDALFDFDMSNVRSSIREEIPYLLALIRKHTDCKGRKPPMSLFGHADPVGSDDYNKVLSGRRASSIYALLTRNTEIWNTLYTTPHGGEDWTKNNNAALRDMAQFVQDNSKSAASASVDQQVQQAAADSGARMELFKQYMDLICRDKDGTIYVADKTNDFLARGDDSGGKGDYQGCSEFNPVLLFSNADLQQSQQDTDKTKRDAANQPNRRVMLLLFRPGAKVSTTYWPCPRASEGVAGCRLRFWSDGDTRRTNTDQERQFDKTHDTFACRFYQRLLTGSPCEENVKCVPLQIRLIDDRDKAYGNTAYRLEVGELTLHGVTSDEGVVQQLIPADVSTGRLVLLYTPPKGQGDAKDFWALDLQIVATMPASDTMAGAQARLNNLGLFAAKTISGEPDEQTHRALQRFQTRFKVQDDTGKRESGGTLTSQTAFKLKAVYGS